MCGIFCSISRHGHIAPDARTTRLLQNRGPDSTGQHQVLIPRHPVHAQDGVAAAFHATFLSTVLSLRGDSIITQPLHDSSTGSVLCWNGEAWSIGDEVVSGNDSQLVFGKLLSASSDSSGPKATVDATIKFLSSIKGPYAFVFFDARHNLVYYGRDCLGRRSLLKKSMNDHTLVLSSVCDNASGEAWTEVEADGVYVIDLSAKLPNDPTSLPTQLIPHRRSNQDKIQGISFDLPFPALNRKISHGTMSLDTQLVDRLRAALSKSLSLRVQHVREAVQLPSLTAHRNESRVAVLFSGGLDCTILARMCHDLLPLDESIDLLNVAFENPRIHAKLEEGVSPYETCPDRMTGRSSYAELQETCPGRHWQFVQVNVPYVETVAQRTAVMSLMHPHNTEMDLSISYALYFASRGKGVTQAPDANSLAPYTTSAHVLLSGLGADELFGGYQRHATAFARMGYAGLLDELQLDFDRLGKRNLGRDDRAISNSCREARFPYLDEDFIALALELPVTVKCDFGAAQILESDDANQQLEPAKRILRLLAWQLGLKGVAAEKKRAIQFGARTAKMETGKTKGTTLVA